ncbi:sulfite exporter TauE/SafE family protein [Thermosynechococcaceae cyanobacterium BACA0444]|uniref:Probable membrane transporter protein n=1 Tax=Pseudocalidococcus azoricus BACA0444 TaxID=2918990 RepID=A0AAE4JWP2_9CYAN|nr:sulfite exporter TauE/SafE family protein [Pseudocalidococcus azoricus]MDS3860368.1 sulfite exporter TauE/SafE family protein [Pseudocalidococcus azoricus BACA0444]
MEIYLIVGGLVAGTLAGLLGIGGGVIMVPLLVSLGFQPVVAVGTSTVAIIITAVAGTVQNARMGYWQLNKILSLGIPAAFTAPLGSYLAAQLPDKWLLIAFAIMLLVNIYLMQLRANLKESPETSFNQSEDQATPVNSQTNLLQRFGAVMFIGGIAGLMAGLFGIGGGVIMVSLQVLLLGDTIKAAIQTSLAVIMITAVSAVIAHGVQGNVAVMPGIILGLGGVLATQFSTRLLPRLPNQVVILLFNVFMLVMSGYIYYQALNLP